MMLLPPVCKNALLTVPKEFQDRYLELVTTQQDLERQKAIAWMLPHLLRNKPEALTCYREHLDTSTELLECLPRALVQLSDGSQYVTLVRFFEDKSDWVASCVARYCIPLLQKTPEKIESYKRLLTQLLSVNEIWAGEAAEHLHRIFSLQLDATQYCETIVAMQEMWLGIEVSGYLPETLEQLPKHQQEKFLASIWRLAKHNPLKAAQLSRLVQKEKNAAKLKAGEAQYDRLTGWEGDQFGHFDFHVFNDAQIIRARHYRNESHTIHKIIEGSDAMSIYSTIHELALVSNLQHASWIGYELGRAERALRERYWFEQDQPLEEKWQ